MTISHEEAQPNYRAPTAVIADYLRRSISISYLLGLAWTGRLFIITTTLAGMLCAAYTVHAHGPSFTATMEISPADTENSLGDLGGTGGLLAGLTGSSSTVALPKFTQFLIAKGSVEVSRDLDRKYDLLCRIYRGDCDQATHQWKERTGIKEWLDGMLARLAGLPDPNGPRTIQDLATYISNEVTVEENKKNSMVYLRYKNRNPEFAAQFLAAVFKVTNDYIRTQSHDTQTRYVDYLSNSAAKTTNVEQRVAIDNLLLQEERQLMMTEVDAPYAAKVLEGPTVAPVNDALKTIVIGGILGFLLGVILASSRDLMPQKWRFW
jgi:uncharacterized protein involved in exopolysaccharide biosynthesis